MAKKERGNLLGKLEEKERILDDKILMYDKEVAAIRAERKRILAKEEAVKDVARAIAAK